MSRYKFKDQSGFLFATLTTFILFATVPGHGQSCLPNGITFTSQGAIDNFPASFPGCQVIEGTVSISGAGITNLSGLNAVTAIGDSLLIYQNPDLGSLNGLENLTEVGGSIYIYDNPALVTLSALGGLKDTLNSVNIFNNYPLTNGAGLFDNIRYVRGNLNFSGAWISSLAHFSNLRGVGGGLSIGANQLTNLQGLENLRSVGALALDCRILDNLQALSNLTYIGPIGLFIAGNLKLKNFHGLENLSTLGTLYLTKNVALTSLEGLKSIDTIFDLAITHNEALTHLGGLDSLTAVLGYLWIEGNTVLTDLSSLGRLRSIGGILAFRGNHFVPDLSCFGELQSIGAELIIKETSLTSLKGLSKLHSVNDILLSSNNNLAALTGLDSLTAISGGLTIEDSHLLTDLAGLEKINAIGGSLVLYNNSNLTTLNGLGGLKNAGAIHIEENKALTTLEDLGPVKSLQELLIKSSGSGLTMLKDLHGLDSLQTITGNLTLTSGSFTLDGLEQLTSVGGDLNMTQIGVQSLAPLGKLTSIGGTLTVFSCHLPDLKGLNHHISMRSLDLEWNNSIASLSGLDSLQILEGNLSIEYNGLLADLRALKNLSAVNGKIDIRGNYMLSDCAIQAVCNRIFSPGLPPTIFGNAPGCESPADIALQCGGSPLRVSVWLDNNNNCLADAGDKPAADIQVLLADNTQMTVRAANGQGIARFFYKDTSLLSLSLPQFPMGNWGVCRDTIPVDPDTLTGASVTTFLLKPLNPCPELTVDLSLPGNFRGCLATSFLGVHLINTGVVTVKDFTVAVVLPPVLDLVNFLPWFTAQNGDTLFYEFIDVELPPFSSLDFILELRTKCDAFLFGQTLCVEAFVIFENPCPATLPPFSEIKLSAECLADTTLRFTIKNIGDAPTQSLHQYTLIRNDVVLNTVAFSLVNQHSITVDMPADGATWRMEATKFDDGRLTATALENCGGLTPGLITAFWLDRGPAGYDFDCQLVVTAYDPNQKSAVPTGAGPDHLLGANIPLQYTIDFQNTGTDTAFRVLLRDILPPGLDIHTFRPGFASHPYTWEIRGMDTLEVFFFPIMLPDSNVNEPTSHGFFTFEMEQNPDLPDGTTFENTASIIFDFNPPIATNTVVHRIGQLTIRADEPQRYPDLWQVSGNPTRYVAIFRAKSFIIGEKQFELYNVAGHLVRRAQFSGQTFELRRDMLPGGVYLFRIGDANGRLYTGKIVVLE